MEDASDTVIDVTKRLAEVLPDFLPDWTGAKLYLVSGKAPWWVASFGMRVCQVRGGLSAGALRKISDYIERELPNSISLRDLASISGLSDCHFARAFKQSVGMPPHRYVMNRRVERAVVLIQTTNRPLSQIALEVGFYDQSHLSRLIARTTDQTPRELRRESFEPIGKEAAPGVVT